MWWRCVARFHCGLVSSGRKMKQKAGVRDKTHYIHYQPSDHLSERGLSLGSAGFDVQASSAVLDLDGDDEASMHMRKARSSTLRWYVAPPIPPANILFILLLLPLRDRKRKKFVGPSSEEQKQSKRIKTEAGQWIKASYKSDMYKKWKDKHKIETLTREEEEGQGAGSQTHGHRGLGRLPRKFGYGGKKGAVKPGWKKGREMKSGGKKGREMKSGGKMGREVKPGGKTGREVADLKPKNLILMKRRRKEVMEQRMKLKRKGQGQTREHGRKNKK